MAPFNLPKRADLSPAPIRTITRLNGQHDLGSAIRLHRALLRRHKMTGTDQVLAALIHKPVGHFSARRGDRVAEY